MQGESHLLPLLTLLRHTPLTRICDGQSHARSTVARLPLPEHPWGGVPSICPAQSNCHLMCLQDLSRALIANSTAVLWMVTARARHCASLLSSHLVLYYIRTSKSDLGYLLRHRLVRVTCAV